MKRKCRSIRGESAKNAIVVADILVVFTAKAESRGEAILEIMRAWSIKVMLTDQTMAVAKAMKTPLNKTFLATLLDPVFSWLTNHVPTIMTTMPSKRKDVTCSLRNKIAKNVVNKG